MKKTIIYKNGIKQYAIVCFLSAILFGPFMGLFYGLISYSLKAGIIVGVAAGISFGVLFTLALAIFSKYLEKKAEQKRAEISKDRTIICEGPANHKRGVNAIGGWLFVTENSIEFYPHKINIGGQDINILSDDLIGVTTKRNQLIIQTKSEAYAFVVNKSKLWEKSIKETCKSI